MATISNRVETDGKLTCTVSDGAASVTLQFDGLPTDEQIVAAGEAYVAAWQLCNRIQAEISVTEGQITELQRQNAQRAEQLAASQPVVEHIPVPVPVAPAE